MNFLRRTRSSRGQSIIEAALLLPLLLLVVFGITEFGRALMTVNVLTQAAREGARLAAVGASQATIETRVLEVLSSSNVTAAQGGITITGPDPLDEAKKVTVVVQTNFEVLSASVLPFSGTIPLAGTSVMRFEGSLNKS